MDSRGNAAIVTLDLTYRCPAASGWHDAQRLEHSGPEGGSVQVAAKPTIDVRLLTVDQREALKEAILTAMSAPSCPLTVRCLHRFSSTCSRRLSFEKCPGCLNVLAPKTCCLEQRRGYARRKTTPQEGQAESVLIALSQRYSSLRQMLTIRLPWSQLTGAPHQSIIISY